MNSRKATRNGATNQMPAPVAPVPVRGPPGGPRPAAARRCAAWRAAVCVAMLLTACSFPVWAIMDGYVLSCPV